MKACKDSYVKYKTILDQILTYAGRGEKTSPIFWPAFIQFLRILSSIHIIVKGQDSKSCKIQRDTIFKQCATVHFLASLTCRTNFALNQAVL